jgi:uncharacterized protein YgbK (DUF1537 family)
VNEPTLDRQSCLASLPPPWAEDPLPAIRAEVERTGRTVIVLDDDPTGTQTVHDVPIITEWSVEALSEALRDEAPAVYVLTNSRSLPLAEAQALNREIGRNLKAASAATSRPFVVVSRSDSTLRGHFPGEVDALCEGLGGGFDAWLLIPFFEAGGRLTVNDVHYVAEGDSLVPAAQTPFAADHVFGYRRSNLRRWAEEKTAGRVQAEDVCSVSLNDIRRGGPGRVAELLGRLSGGCICVVNAACQRDVEVFALGLLAAEVGGKRFLYRTAASFVPARSGIAPRPLVGREELHLASAGGALLVFGSYVPKSTQQLSHLMEHGDVDAVEVAVEKLLDDGRRAGEIERAAAAAEAGLQHGRDTVIFTSRRLVTDDAGRHNLSIGRRVSDSLVSIVRSIGPRPRYLLGKGGITASDIATKACGVKRAMVLGQVLPGVPVWRLGEETPHPQMPYVVFPGNVGGEDAVTRIVGDLRR